MRFSWLGLLLFACVGQASPLYQDAKALLETEPEVSWSRFLQVESGLSALPGWLQRDWYLLGAQAQLRLKNWALVASMLQQADQSLTSGLGAAEVALTAGTLSYQRQQYQDAWYWFLCTDSFDNPPEIASKIALNLGVLAGLQQEPAVAERHYLRGLQLAESHQFLHLTPMFYNNLGLLAWRQGELAKAEQYLRQAVYGHSRVSGYESQARSVLNLLVVLAFEEKWPQISRYLHKAQSLVQQQKNPDYPLLLKMIEQLPPVRQDPKLSGQLVALAEQIKSHSLRKSLSLLLGHFEIHWQAGEPKPAVAADRLQLPNTSARCPVIQPPL